MIATKNSLLIDAKIIFTLIASGHGFLTDPQLNLIDAQGLAGQWLERFEEVMAVPN